MGLIRTPSGWFWESRKGRDGGIINEGVGEEPVEGVRGEVEGEWRSGCILSEAGGNEGACVGCAGVFPHRDGGQARIRRFECCLSIESILCLDDIKLCTVTQWDAYS
jgi:hypothetical protein